MTGARFKPGFLLSIVSTAAVVCGCRAAEPVRFNVPSGAGGIFIMTGSGGGGGFAGAGSGGAIGSGGSGGEDDAGSVEDSGSGGGSGGAPMDSGTPTDTGGPMDSWGPPDVRRDIPAPRDLRPVGPTTRFNCYVIPRWEANTPYKAGDRVFQIADLRVYQCRPWPYEGWCPLPAYQPGDETTGYWRDAWVQIGYCE